MGVAYVTGAFGGIGRVIGTALVAAGCRVAMFNLPGALPADTGLGEAVIALPLDVTDPESVEAGVGTAEAEVPPCDLLVNNAGTFSVCAPVW